MAPCTPCLEPINAVDPSGLIVGGTCKKIKHAASTAVNDGGTGRWTQPDPLDQPGDLAQQNRFLYVANDSINSVDPSGQGILGDVLAAGNVVAVAASCTLVETGVTAAFCIGGLAQGAAGVGLAAHDQAKEDEEKK